MAQKGLKLGGVVLILFALIAIGVALRTVPSGSSLTLYEQEVMQWQSDFVEKLTREDGYLAIAGLFELSRGVFNFGSDPDCEFRITSSDDNPIPPHLGRFTHVDGRTVFDRTRDIGVTDYYGNPVAGMPIMEAAAGDTEGTTFRWGSLTWTLIRRGVAEPNEPGLNPFLPTELRDSLGEHYYIRVWDTQNPMLDIVGTTEFFPIDEAWRFEGEFRAFDEPKPLYQMNVLGLVEDSMSTGVVVFEKDGVEYALDTVDEGDNLFIVFGDETNGTETYGAGRFMDVAKPTEGTGVVVDFNKTRNPWCAYSEFTTCAYPTKNNTLPFSICAGALPPKGKAVPATSDK